MTEGENVRTDPTRPTTDAQVGDSAAAGRRGWLRRHAAEDDDDGPFFPPEPHDRPRPRPGPARADDRAPARPRPRPRPSAAADVEQSDVGQSDVGQSDVGQSDVGQAPEHAAPDTAPAAPPDTAVKTPPDTAAELAAPAVAEKPKGKHAKAKIVETKRAKVKRAETDRTETDGAETDGAETDGAETDRTEIGDPGRRRDALRSRRWVRFAIKLTIAVVIAAVAALVLRAYVVAPYYIPSASMEPTLKGGGGDTDDRILVDKVTYRIHEPHEGDIVVFDRPATWHIRDQTLVKRVIGLPGDDVSLRNGLVYVNGMRLNEPYLNKDCGPAPTRPLTSTSKWTVPMGDYFVMGDNRCNSEDSRMFGPVPSSKIVGHVVLIVWPLSRFGSP